MVSFLLFFSFFEKENRASMVSPAKPPSTTSLQLPAADCPPLLYQPEALRVQIRLPEEKLECPEQAPNPAHEADPVCTRMCARTRTHTHTQGPGTRLLRVRLVELFPLWRAPLFPKCSDDLVRPPDLETPASRGHEDPPPTSLILPHPLSIHSLGDPGCVG